LTVVELIGLVPEITPYHVDLRSHPQGHGGVDHVDETPETRQAVASGQVRRALRHGVYGREGRATVHDARGEPPGRRAGRPFHGIHHQLVDEAGDEADVVGVSGDVLDVPSHKRSVVISLSCGVGGVDDVVAGPEDRARFVGVDVPVALLVRRRCYIERLGDAFTAGGGVVVALAEGESVDDVGGLADGGGGELYGGGGGVLGESGGHLFKVVAEYVGGCRRWPEASKDEEQDAEDDVVHHG